MRKERSKAVDTILAEFPRPVVLVRSELQRFFDMGFAMLLGASALYYLWQHRSLGGAALALAVLGLAGCIAFRRPTLRLDRHGFARGRSARRGDEVKDFRLWGACPAMLLCHSDRPHGGVLGSINRIMRGRYFMIPLTFGLPSDDVLDLMIDWRERALRGD